MKPGMATRDSRTFFHGGGGGGLTSHWKLGGGTEEALLLLVSLHFFRKIGGHAEQVKGQRPDKGCSPDPLGWGLSIELLILSGGRHGGLVVTL